MGFGDNLNKEFLCFKRKIHNKFDDSNYIKDIILDSIKISNDLLSIYEYNNNNSLDGIIYNIYSKLSENTRKNIRLLNIIYSNIYDDNGIRTKEVFNLKSNVLDIIFKNIELSKKIRKILYWIDNTTHKFMLFDIITDIGIDISLLNIISSRENGQ